MKITVLGLGAWGFCLASLLAKKGYRVCSWSTHEELVKQLQLTREHVSLPGHRSEGDMTFTIDMEEALKDAGLVVESVTSKGLRPVLEKAKSVGFPSVPLVLTSKGVEQDSGLILPKVATAVLGDQAERQIGALSGPSFAHDVIRGLPTSVVGSAWDSGLMQLICETFSHETFRVYPNSDLIGVALGGALKNIIAIACGFSEGLALGYSCNAALMTRGLHEIKKLAVAMGCRAETLYGLSGMGDLCLTCSSLMSRNYRFGHLIAEGNSPKAAKEKIGMVVEGAYTCVSAKQLAEQLQVAMPITEAVYKILYEEFDPSQAVRWLMQRTVKEEHL